MHDQEVLRSEIDEDQDSVGHHGEAKRLLEVGDHVLLDELLGLLEHHADDVGHGAGEDPWDADEVEAFSTETFRVVQVDEGVKEQRSIEEDQTELKDPHVPGVHLGLVAADREQWEDVLDLVFISLKCTQNRIVPNFSPIIDFTLLERWRSVLLLTEVGRCNLVARPAPGWLLPQIDPGVGSGSLLSLLALAVPGARW